jgi:enamine deaminase RidA (YjgF/YER057c/UK114 family)
MVLAMTVEAINPDGLAPPKGYSHAIVATVGRLVFLAGQEPEDELGNVVGAGDLAVQAGQVFDNLGRALATAGARPDQVTARAALFGGHKPADTLVGVEALSRSAFLIEIDATAVID